MVHGDLPLAVGFLPHSIRDFGVVLNVFVKIPFLDGLLHVLENLASAGVEVRPIWVWVKWKCL